MSNHITHKHEAIERIGDAEIYHAIANNFADNIPDYIQQLTTAFERSNFADLQRTAHSVKSNCATIGAEGAKIFFADFERSLSAYPENTLKQDIHQAIKILTEIRSNIDWLSNTSKSP